jgi:hypothetical protein
MAFYEKGITSLAKVYTEQKITEYWAHEYHNLGPVLKQPVPV